ncbi:MAG TPA: methyl-accepting chemotaxis protein [Kofleriaceae bacterium]|nr:methyl-accepting chemotaxis protein [Kofleriaceae bacterium]
MDSQTLGIGVFVGVVIGALAVGLLLRAHVRASERLVGDTERALEEARRRILELTGESAALVEAGLRSIAQASGEAHGSISSHSASFSDVTAGLAALIAKVETGEGGDVEIDGAAVTAAEQATENLAGRERAVRDALEDLRARTELVSAVIEGAAAEERMTAHKIDDLVAAAAESVGVASNMDDMIRTLQASAAETSDLSAQVSTEAERGYRAVHRTLDEIERIRRLTDAARARIEALGARVADIGHIVKVIQEITEKTNLLALNASIIAAQAGEHGRSFAVVASEIKALAHRTATSTKEISEQIRSVQEESDRAGAAMVDGVAAVEDGFQVAISAGDALDAIRQSAKAAQKKVQGMTRTLRQQNTLAEQVVDSAAQVSDRAGSFANSVRGQSSTAERLRGAALDIQAGARDMIELLREHGSSTTLCVDTIARLSDRMTLLRRRELELRHGLRGIEPTIFGSKKFGDDMAARWASIQEATTRLQDGVDVLRRT